MTATDASVRSVITDEQVQVLNRARSVLETIESDASARALRAPSHLTGEEPYAQNLGRLAGVATMAADNLFQVLNVASAYGVVALTEDQLHNRGEA